MPFVTEEIYNNLPFKDNETIMLSKYPEYNSNLIFEEEKIGNNIIDFIKKFRNIKAENNMDKTIKVKIENNEDYNLINKMLKIEDNIITDDLDIKKYIVEDGNYKMTIYYEKVETEEDKELKLKQIESLKNSIARRKKLLDNKNYVEKAPEKLVLEEKEKLMNEEKLLANLLA